MTEIEPGPPVFVTLKARIVERGTELPRRQYPVAAFVLDHLDEIAFAAVTNRGNSRNATTPATKTHICQWRQRQSVEPMQSSAVWLPLMLDFGWAGTFHFRA
jgi:hypothetical protein